ncbi:hypothetical protein CDEST_00856 [Colletotrichum destructivum]|uniref:Uncharacterized protein n=1 Tax=Colletotrichum destructivum TaxID=34406 RepID=A0AAX4HYI4_9PEZI|nr:hypothetical protein CDEST_00856 [Colletotrichum destructivum]
MVELHLLPLLGFKQLPAVLDHGTLSGPASSLGPDLPLSPDKACSILICPSRSTSSCSAALGELPLLHRTAPALHSKVHISSSVPIFARAITSFAVGHRHLISPPRFPVFIHQPLVSPQLPKLVGITQFEAQPLGSRVKNLRGHPSVYIPPSLTSKF